MSIKNIVTFGFGFTTTDYIATIGFVSAEPPPASSLTYQTGIIIHVGIGL